MNTSERSNESIRTELHERTFKWMEYCSYERRKKTETNKKRWGASNKSIISVSTDREHTDHGEGGNDFEKIAADFA